MTKQNIYSPKPDAIDEGPTTKKIFVEPEITGPIDVLEATAFFVGGSAITDVDQPII